MTKPLQSGLLTESNMALFADYYELTMGKADFDNGNNAICTENYFVRYIPQGEYLIAAGLEQVIHYILNLRFTDADLKWLKESKPTPDMSDDFLDYLRHFKFDGDVYAVPEGTPVFPNEPLINVTGPSIDIQIFETYLLNIMNFQTLIATKTARIVHAARGRTCFDFGARRAHGRDAGILAARGSFIGGAAGTSLVIAGAILRHPLRRDNRTQVHHGPSVRTRGISRLRQIFPSQYPPPDRHLRYHSGSKERLYCWAGDEGKRGATERCSA